MTDYETPRDRARREVGNGVYIQLRMLDHRAEIENRFEHAFGKDGLHRDKRDLPSSEDLERGFEQIDEAFSAYEPLPTSIVIFISTCKSAIRFLHDMAENQEPSANDLDVYPELLSRKIHSTAYDAYKAFQETYGDEDAGLILCTAEAIGAIFDRIHPHCETNDPFG